MGFATTSELTGQAHPKNPGEELGCQQLPVWIKHHEPETSQIITALLPLILRNYRKSLHRCLRWRRGTSNANYFQKISSGLQHCEKKAPNCFLSVNVLPAAKDLT